MIEADSPTRLRSILNARQIRLKTINDEPNSILPVMLSKFKLSSDQPGVLSIEGVDSLKIIYDEIIQTNKDVLIMSSPHDRDDPEISAMLDEQITRQRAAGIKTFALVQESIYDAIVKSTDDLFEVKKLPDGTSFDAQIIICGDTVISTVYNQGVSSSIIVSPETANTLRSVFYLIWNRS